MVSVILEPGAAVAAAELLRHCEESLPYYAVPRYFRIVPHFPKTQTAKVLEGRAAAHRHRRIPAHHWGPRGRSKRG